MANGLLIIGAGGHGRVVADAAEASGQWDKIAFVDDKYPDVSSASQWSVIGRISDLESLKSEWNQIVVAIGNNSLRVELLEQCKGTGFSVASVIHPSAVIAKDVSMGEGAVVFANTVVNTGVVLGRGVILNTAATVDHDCMLGEGVHLSPGVHLGGTVEIDSYTWLGVGASVVNNCNIGSGVTVGAGTVIIDDIDDQLTVVGMPAKPVGQ